MLRRCKLYKGSGLGGLKKGSASCIVELLMDKILHDPKDPKLWELWYIPYNG